MSASLALDQNGSAWNSAGNSLGIGNDLDHSLLLALRRQSKAIVTSARTFTAEQYRLPTRGMLVVVGNKSTPHSTRLDDGKGRLVLVGPSSARSRIPNSSWWANLPNNAETLKKNLNLQRLDRIHLEFGPSGIESNQGLITLFFCTAPNPEVATNFVNRQLNMYCQRLALKLDEQELSLWQSGVAKYPK